MRKDRVIIAVTLVSGVLLISCGSHTPCERAACFETATQVTRLELHASCGERLWAIRGDGATTIKNVEYGIVPRGFRQIYPISKQPRALNQRECIVLLWEQPGDFVRHFGKAVGPGTIHYGYYMGGPARLTEDQLFAPGGENEATKAGCSHRTCA